MARYTHQDLIDQILHFVAEHGRNPTCNELSASKVAFARKFGTFANAIRAAGLKHKHRTSDEMNQPCAHCGTTIKSINNRKFCNQSCAAKHNNVTRQLTPRSTRIKQCVVCSTQHRNRKYCSSHCQHTDILCQFEAGLVLSRSTMRKCLIEFRGRSCEICKLTHWLNEDIVLEVDHIDGNASNNIPANLRLLCPNCHSTTLTWKGKNKGNGRKSRGLSLS